nr:MAG TPA: hypothetical protein [Caudoviricetes sp.]
MVFQTMTSIGFLHNLGSEDCRQLSFGKQRRITKQGSSYENKQNAKSWPK